MTFSQPVMISGWPSVPSLIAKHQIRHEMDRSLRDLTLDPVGCSTLIISFPLRA